ncbi:hypothetical protein [Burkholderia multivorans]|uniref:hypothetical protein n=1 Tax=Burkholderia multivorans TaxID=87883 RepID=UPI001C2647C0|nr:hypothetical protein [Burkholderia multivorans]MBU9592708.1 hypothetical protein [Burkholderia multivorans]
MIDQDKMWALAKCLRADADFAGERESGSFDLRYEAADVIDLLLAEVEAAAADKRDGHRYRELLGLLLAGDIPMPESSVSLNVCGVPPNQDEFNEVVDFLLAQRQGEGS